MSFASFPLDSIGLGPKHVSACSKAGLYTAADVMTASPADLAWKLKLNQIPLANELIREVSRCILPASHTVAELLDASQPGKGGEKSGNGSGQLFGLEDEEESVVEQKEEGLTAGWIRTGDTLLDNALGGGLRIGAITEFSGESASGKSHFCLALALAAQFPSLTLEPGATMILTSEREIATARMVELAQQYLSAHDPQGEVTRKSLLDNVLSSLFQDITALDHALSYQIPLLLESRRSRTTSHSPLLGHLVPKTSEPAVAEAAGSDSTAMPIRLLIVDSIAALIRGADHAYGNTNRAGLAARSKYLCSVSDKLKALALEFNLAVVVVNQVSDVIERTVPSTNYRPIRPAAGGVTATPILRHGYSASQHSSQAPPSTPMLSQFYTDGAAPPMLYATQSRWFSGQTETLVKEASLGIVWANAINVRVMLSRTGRRRLLNQRDLSRPKPKAPYHDKSQNGSTAPTNGNKGMDGDDADGRPVVDDFRPTLIRRLHVVFSPFAPPSTTDYVITTSGIHSVPDSYRLLDHAEARKKSDLLARLAAEAAVINGEDPVDSSREDEDDEDDEDDHTREARRRGQTDFEIDKQMRLNRQLDGFRPLHTSEDDDGDGEGAGTRREGSDGEADFGGEVFDDFGDLPAEFWDLEGNYDGVPQGPPGDGEAREEGSAP